MVRTWRRKRGKEKTSMGELIFGISLIFVLGMYIGWILSDWKNTTKYENILKLSTTMMGQSREIWERIVQTKRKEYGVQKKDVQQNTKKNTPK